MQVTAYRCDVCRLLSEDKPKFYIEEGEHGFKISKHSAYKSLDKGACSDDCARAALKVWLEERGKPKESALTQAREEYNGSSSL